MALFERKNFVSAAGLDLDWKIECDNLSDEDWQTIAKVGARNLPAFGKVIGIPRGGLKLADIMKQYSDTTSNLTLMVDDVYTTGKNINEHLDKFNNSVGFVAFARGVGYLPNAVYAFARTM